MYYHDMFYFPTFKNVNTISLLTYNILLCSRKASRMLEFTECGINYLVQWQTKLSSLSWSSSRLKKILYLIIRRVMFIMKRKFKQWWSTMSPIWRKQQPSLTLNHWTQRDHNVWNWKSRSSIETGTQVWWG